MKVNTSVCVCFGFFYPLKEVSTQVEACLLPVRRLMYIIQLVSVREVRRVAEHYALGAGNENNFILIN